MHSGRNCHHFANTSTLRQTSGRWFNHQRHLLCRVRLPVAKPHDMPPWQTVYYHFRKWKADDTWLLIHQALHEQTRRDVGKEPSPTAAIIDSQSVKTTELAATRGFDGHKRVKGRTLVTDTTGIPLMVKVTDDVSDQIRVTHRSEYITIRADAAFAENWKTGYLAHQCQLEIAYALKLSDGSFSWLGWFRRLTLD